MGSGPPLVKSNEPHAKMRLGQHFLRDTGVLDRIVRWIQPSAEDLFLEIGAGDGTLSVRLAPRVHRLLAVEFDRDCIPRLKEALAPFESASVIQGDALKMDYGELLNPQRNPVRKLRIAGNLPYNIATAIIDRLLHLDLDIHDMSFLLQLEVAERISAEPGTRPYGFLSVEYQHHAEVRMGFKVPPACFVPRPKVTSAVLSLRPKHSPRAPSQERMFEALGKAAFAHRRKTLANSLLRHPLFRKDLDLMLEAAGIDGAKRAQDLCVEEYERLARAYHEHFSSDSENRCAAEWKP